MKNKLFFAIEMIDQRTTNTKTYIPYKNEQWERISCQNRVLELVKENKVLKTYFKQIFLKKHHWGMKTPISIAFKKSREMFDLNLK